MTASSARRRGQRIGVDLGGTKIEAVVVGLDSAARGAAGPTSAAGAGPASAVSGPAPAAGAGDEPRVLARARVPTKRELGYEHVLEATRALVFEVAKQAGVDVIATPMGVAMPGSVTTRRPDGGRSDVALVKNSNTTCLNGRPFHADLARAVGREIAFSNDANCFALAEATWGAARGARVTFGVILGTGVGGGVVLTSDAGTPRAWDGAQGIAGEWGHVTLDPERGPACYCGRRGCVETYLSGPAIEREYAQRSGVPRSLAEIAARGKKEDDVARTLLDERVELFGRALATVIDVLDPDVIVLGGGVSNLEQLYEAGPSAVARWIFNDELATRIVKHALGDSAGVLGAALLP
ncbi:MAG: ROK family protein [Labilithrix sp.]|nr:ROK family protein [Labilithrix sp.]